LENRRIKMDEVVDLVIEGYLCERCGSFIDSEVGGYPRKCEDCKGEEKEL